MTTPRIRSLVSLAAMLTATLLLGGCASASQRAALANETVINDDVPQTLRFDNEGRDYVHVYLVGVRREWWLGRVAPGARATLRIPADAQAEDLGSMRLAALAGGPVALRAASDARTEFTIPQSAKGILSQRWTYSPLLSRGQQLTGSPKGRATIDH